MELNTTLNFNHYLVLINLTYGQEKLEEVIVNSSLKNEQQIKLIKKNAQSTELVTSDELNRNNPAFIEQSVGTAAGIQVDKRTQLGGQRFVIRGYGNDQKFNSWGIKAYYNSIPITTADGVTLFDDVDFSLVNSIEIIKGPASTNFGSGVGGVILLNTNYNPPKGFSIESKNSIGSFNLIQFNNRLNYVTQNSSSSINYGHIESEGYRPHGASFKNYLSYLADYKISDRQKINLLLSYNNSNEEVAGQISYQDYYAGIDYGNPAYIKKDARTQIKSMRLGLNFENKITTNFKNDTSLFYYNGDNKRIAAGAYEVSKNSNYGIRSVFNLNHQINNQWNNNLDFGTEIQQSTHLISNYRFLGTDDTIPLLMNDISKGSYFNYSNNQLGIFAKNQLEYSPYKLMFVVGIGGNSIHFKREDLFAFPGLISGYNKNLSFYKTFPMVFNPHFAIQKQYKQHIFNLSYSFGYNAPTAATSFIPDINQPNNNLTPEKAKMIDLSINGAVLDSKLNYQIAFFNMIIKDKLSQLSAINPQTGTSYNYWVNTGTQNNNGIELSLKYHKKFHNPIINSIQPFVNFTYNHFFYKEFKTIISNKEENYQDKKVVGIPDIKYSIGLDFDLWKGIYFQNTFNYLGKVYTDFANTNQVNGYQQLNAKIGFKKKLFNDKLFLDIYCAGNNLTNQINYTFLFLGNNINDSDPGNNYPKNTATDINPGPSTAYFFSGINLKFIF